MSFELGNRVSILERILKKVVGDIRDLISRVQRAEQAQWQIPGTFGGGGDAGVYTCNPSGSIAGATGTIGSQTCSSVSVTVYQCSAGNQNSLGTRTVYNTLPAATTAGKQMIVLPDGAGNFYVVSQSCT